MNKSGCIRLAADVFPRICLNEPLLEDKTWSDYRSSLQFVSPPRGVAVIDDADRLDKLLD